MAGIPHEKKKMFGCPAFFAQGNMFAGVYRSSIFLRLGEEDRNTSPRYIEGDPAL
ncbi:MAG: TfoX/Sxy family protein [Comamonadaceae bacterium]|nr:TfoX/Sxy family protein [Comamonadaceae bacterium]